MREREVAVAVCTCQLPSSILGPLIDLRGEERRGEENLVYGAEWEGLIVFSPFPLARLLPPPTSHDGGENVDFCLQQQGKGIPA